ncbi:hypothetical protein BOTBODRAFT_608728 [Botryobasidium botryosum FD-172 SS1]|uniref:Uncharacterized protein n=1 Tax=Botryobasidium botryosum (strain FD-172 SS1) TaxID=930990 RepID=A0A067LWB8_BOTB1|nr:hypothetical protein BOTBODRAFT_608728 [Botryobasidium botryosum FD-172 SS1]
MGVRLTLATSAYFYFDFAAAFAARESLFLIRAFSTYVLLRPAYMGIKSEPADWHTQTAAARRSSCQTKFVFCDAPCLRMPHEQMHQQGMMAADRIYAYQ